MSFLERRLIRTCRIMKRPRKNWPVWVLRLVSAALRTLTRPRLVSSVEPTGIVSAPSSRTKPLGGLACDVLAEPAGSFTKTSPETTVALTVLNGTGALGAVVVVAAVLDPVLVGVGGAAGIAGARPASASRYSPARTARWRCRPRRWRSRGRHEVPAAAVGVRDRGAVGARAVAEQPRDRRHAGPVVVGRGARTPAPGRRCRRPGARTALKRGPAPSKPAGATPSASRTR